LWGAETSNGFPGYSGRFPAQITTLAELQYVSDLTCVKIFEGQVARQKDVKADEANAGRGASESSLAWCSTWTSPLEAVSFDLQPTT
jgi:hypothetical protein